MKKILILSFLFFIIPKISNAVCPDFSMDSGIRLSSATGNYIIPLTGGGYRLFFSTGFGIISATSTIDGLNWTVEQGFRLKSSTFTNYDSNAILKPAIFQASATYYRMIYEGVSLDTSVAHYFLSAVSTDTLNWYKEINSTGTDIGLSAINYKILENSTTIYLTSPYIIKISSFQWRMYYTKTSSGIPQPGAGDVIGSAISADAGVTWAQESGSRIQARSANPACVKLSNGYYRLFWTGSSSSSREPINDAVYSGLSSDGLTFTKETGSRVSVVVGSSITDIQIIRLHEGYNWRLFYNVWVSTVNSFQLYSVLASTPLVSEATPVVGRNNQIIVMNIKGEIFDSTSTVKLIQNATEIVATSVTRINDMELNATFDLTGKPVGLWDLKVTNSDGKSCIVSTAFEIRYPPGEAQILDNLIRVWEHNPAKINFKTYGAGNVKVKIYSLDNRFVKTLMDTNMPANSYSLQWDGTDSNGETVASGVYVVYIEGVELKARKKIVVVK